MSLKKIVGLSAQPSLKESPVLPEIGRDPHELLLPRASGGAEALALEIGLNLKTSLKERIKKGVEVSEGNGAPLFCNAFPYGHIVMQECLKFLKHPHPAVKLIGFKRLIVDKDKHIIEFVRLAACILMQNENKNVQTFASQFLAQGALNYNEFLGQIFTNFSASPPSPQILNSYARICFHLKELLEAFDMYNGTFDMFPSSPVSGGKRSSKVTPTVSESKLYIQKMSQSVRQWYNKRWGVSRQFRLPRSLNTSQKRVVLSLSFSQKPKVFFEKKWDYMERRGLEYGYPYLNFH